MAKKVTQAEISKKLFQLKKDKIIFDAESKKLAAELKKSAKHMEDTKKVLEDAYSKGATTNHAIAIAMQKEIADTVKLIDKVIEDKINKDKEIKAISKAIRELEKKEENLVNVFKEYSESLPGRVEQVKKFKNLISKFDKALIKELPKQEAEFEELTTLFRDSRQEFIETGKIFKEHYTSTLNLLDDVISTSKTDSASVGDLRYNLKVIQEEKKILEEFYDDDEEKSNVINQLILTERQIKKNIDRKTGLINRTVSFLGKQEGNILSIVAGVLTESPAVMWAVSAVDDAIKNQKEVSAKKAAIKADLLKKQRQLHSQGIAGAFSVTGEELQTDDGIIGSRKIQPGRFSGSGCDLSETNNILVRILSAVDRQEKTLDNIEDTEHKRVILDIEMEAEDERRFEAQELNAAEIAAEQSKSTSGFATAKIKDKLGMGSTASSLGLVDAVSLIHDGHAIFGALKKLASGLPLISTALVGIVAATYNTIKSVSRSGKWGVSKISAALQANLLPMLAGMVGLLISGPVGIAAFTLAAIGEMFIPEKYKRVIATEIERATDISMLLFSFDAIVDSIKEVFDIIRYTIQTAAIYVEDSIYKFKNALIDIVPGLKMASNYYGWDIGSTRKKDKEQEQSKIDRLSQLRSERGASRTERSKRVRANWEAAKEIRARKIRGTSTATSVSTPVPTATPPSEPSQTTSANRGIIKGGAPAMRTGGRASPEVNKAILDASAKYGVDPVFMMAMAERESGFEVGKKNIEGGPAKGLYQFLPGTEKDVAKQVTADPGTAEYEAQLGAAYTKQNKEYLTNKLGREPTSGELYQAHFLGPAGAVRMLTADPNALASSVDPGAYAKNKEVFGNKTAGELNKSLGSDMNSRMAKYSRQPVQTGNLKEGLNIKGGANGQAFGGGETHQGTLALAQSINKTGSAGTFTGFNDNYHAGSTSKHASGLALDYALNDPSTSAAEKIKIETMMANAGVKGYVQDEYLNPSKNSTGSHMHAGFNSQEDADAYSAFYASQQSREPSPMPSQANTQYLVSNQTSQSFKSQAVGKTAAGSGYSSGRSKAGSGAAAGSKSGGGGSTGSGRAAPRGNEPTLQNALNTDFSGSTA